MDNTSLGRAVRWLATAVAIAGGTVLVLLTVMTVVSVVGRALIPLEGALARLGVPIGIEFGPVKGDFELVQTGVLFAIFCSLPLTQYLRGHADVAIITDNFSPRVAAAIELVMDLLMLVASTFIVWRYAIGMLDKYGNREMTFILHAPIWWSYAAGMLGAVSMVIVAAYCVVRSAANTFSKTPGKPEPGIF